MSLKPAFSTVACPDWTLENVADAAAKWDFAGVELRTFGQGGSGMACDPGLTDGQKVRRIFRHAGVSIAGVATGARFEKPLFPPVVGSLRIFDPHACINEAKHYIDVAHDVGAPYVRVYGFSVPGREKRRYTLNRIVERLRNVCDHARNRDVVVHIENGGGFPYASDLTEIMERVNSHLLFASYDVLAASEVEDDPADAMRLLGDRLAAIRLRDRRDGSPTPLGQGETPCRDYVDAAIRTGVDAWLIYDWERLWQRELAGAEQILPNAARLMYEWTTPTATAAA